MLDIANKIQSLWYSITDKDDYIVYTILYELRNYIVYTILYELCNYIVYTILYELCNYIILYYIVLCANITLMIVLISIFDTYHLFLMLIKTAV